LPFGRGPALRAGYAYWISKHRLVRRRFLAPDGPVEVLAQDARDGTRVAAAPESTPVAAVAYIGHSHSGELKAKLWTEGAPVLELSPEGTAASTVAFAASRVGVVVVSLEGRTSMTPVHARVVTFEQHAAKLGEDVVVWVGGSAQPSMEVTALGTPEDLWAFVTMERNVTSFGLARIHIGTALTMNAEVTWRSYPNGLDPAPLASGVVCGSPAVLYVRPATAEPHAAQELHFAKVGEEGLGPSKVLAHARGFSNVSFTQSDDLALVSYVADRRTWAALLPCKSL
jgi:hypothetical protein